MTSYHPLTDDDPFLGDAGALRDFTCALRTSEMSVTNVINAVKGVADASRDTWIGDAADGFRAVSIDGTRPLEDIAKRLIETSTMLGNYASALTFAQGWGRAYASQAQEARNARQLIQQQLTAASQTPVPDPFAVNNLRSQLNGQDNEFADIRQKFEELCAEFEDTAIETRASLLGLWDADDSIKLSANAYNREAKKPKLRKAPKKTHVRTGKDKHGDRVRETTTNTTGLIPNKKGSRRAVVTETTATSGVFKGRVTGYDRQIQYASDGKIPPADPKKSKARKVAGSTTATLASASSSAESFYGAEGKKQGKNFGGEAKAGAGAKADANAKVSVTKDGLVASAGASASAKLEATASGSYKSEYVNGDVSVHASVGAEASVESKIGIGPNGVTAAVGGKFFAGGEAGVDGNFDIGGVGAGGHAGVTYGVGGEFDLKTNVSLNDVSIKADFGATLGLGFHASVDIDIHPKELISNAGKAASKVADFFGF